MKTGLITTTIHTPTVLGLYRRAVANGVAKDVQFFIAGDLKTPDLFDGPWVYLSPELQQASWKSSRVLPWNSITRRNMALLAALEWGAEIIVTIDDDNIPLDTDYFMHFENVFSRPFDGLCMDSNTGWFDVGSMVI